MLMMVHARACLRVAPLLSFPFPYHSSSALLIDWHCSLSPFLSLSARVASSPFPLRRDLYRSHTIASHVIEAPSVLPFAHTALHHATSQPLCLMLIVLRLLLSAPSRRHFLLHSFPFLPLCVCRGIAIISSQLFCLVFSPMFLPVSFPVPLLLPTSSYFTFQVSSPFLPPALPIGC